MTTIKNQLIATSFGCCLAIIVAYTCAITGTSLHLVKPLGFSIDDKHLKRAGLDYWHLLDLHIYENLDDFLAQHSDKRLFLATTSCNFYLL